MPTQHSLKLAHHLRELCATIPTAVLAHRTGCSEDSVRRYVAGDSKPSIDFVRTVCELCGAPAERIIRGEDYTLSSEAAMEYARKLSKRQLIQALLERIVDDECSSEDPAARAARWTRNSPEVFQ
jgi:hypothetical protein